MDRSFTTLMSTISSLITNMNKQGFFIRDRENEDYFIDKVYYDPEDDEIYFTLVTDFKDSDWFPTKEKLPENNQKVLVTTRDGYMSIAYYEPKEGWHLAYNGNLFVYDPIAWRPLPEVYKIRKNEKRPEPALSFRKRIGGDLK